MVSLKQTLKDGNSFLRYLEHMRVAKISLSGNVIDLGAKSANERYFSFIDMSGVEKIEFCDILPQSENVLQINLEKPFNIKDNSYDHVMYFNVLEHIYNYQNLIQKDFLLMFENSHSKNSYIPNRINFYLLLTISLSWIIYHWL